MMRLGLERDLVDRDIYDRTVARFREAEIVLPTFGELADPTKIPDRVREALVSIDPDAPHPLNLFRVHWNNDSGRSGLVDVPDHVILSSELTGVEAKIVVALGNRFPMIGAH
jgi:cysteine synthase